MTLEHPTTRVACEGSGPIGGREVREHEQQLAVIERLRDPSV